MNSSAAEDFHAALLAMQEIEAEQALEELSEQEHAVSTLVARVFAFLDGFKKSEKEADYDPVDRLAA